jgi:hypothetical protein
MSICAKGGIVVVAETSEVWKEANYLPNAANDGYLPQPYCELWNQAEISPRHPEEFKVLPYPWTVNQEWGSTCFHIQCSDSCSTAPIRQSKHDSNEVANIPQHIWQDRSAETGYRVVDEGLPGSQHGVNGNCVGAERYHLYSMPSPSPVWRGAVSDHYLQCMPLYHSAGSVLAVGCALFLGATIAIGRRFSTKT